MAALTRNDINKIVYDFDQVYFPKTKKSSSKQEALKHCLETNQFVQILETREGFSLEIVDKIIRHKLKSSPSVRALLLYYRGSPALSRFAPAITQNPLCLEKASRVLLKHLGKVPTRERIELACFKQLMALVFEMHFRGLSLDGQLAMVKKIQGATWELSLPASNNLSVKLNQLQQKLQMNQAGWDKAKVQLQLASWKIQLMIARVLSSLGARVCLMIGSGYCAVRTYFWLKSMGYKIAYKFGQNLEKLSEYGLRTLGVDPHARGGNFPLKAFVILTTILLSSVVGGAYLVARIHILCKDRFPPLFLDIVEWPFVTVSKLINDPAGVAFNLGFGIYNIGESLTAHVARSMDEATVASQKKYIQDKIPTLRDGWCQIILNPPTTVKV